MTMSSALKGVVLSSTENPSFSQQSLGKEIRSLKIVKTGVEARVVMVAVVGDIPVGGYESVRTSKILYMVVYGNLANKGEHFWLCFMPPTKDFRWYEDQHALKIASNNISRTRKGDDACRPLFIFFDLTRSQTNSCL